MFLSFDSDDTLSNVSETGTSNGLNQLTQYAGRTVTSDGKKNVSGYGSDIFTYSSENAMTGSVVGGASTNLTFDPLLRLYQSASGGVTSRFAYDGLDALAEYDGADALQRRWVYDPTTGQPVVWYEGAGTAAADRRYLSADERGSVISVSDSNGAALGINTYDEYGNPGASNLGRYGYTGQAWLASAQLWHLNARMYSPAIGGRFMQPDPIGYAGGINLYAYVANDPVNFVDPLGLYIVCRSVAITTSGSEGVGTVTGIRCYDNGIDISRQLRASGGGGRSGGGGGGGGGGGDADIKQKPPYCANFDYKIAKKADEVGKYATTLGTFGALIPHPVSQGVSKILSGGGAALSFLSNIYTSTYYPSVQGNTSAAVGITTGTSADRVGLKGIPAWAVGQASDWTTDQFIGDPCAN